MLPLRRSRLRRARSRRYAERRCPGTPVLGARRGTPSCRCPRPNRPAVLAAARDRSRPRAGLPGQSGGSRGSVWAAVRGSCPIRPALGASTTPGGTGSRGRGPHRRRGTPRLRMVRDAYPAASSPPWSKLHRMAADRVDTYSASSSSPCWRWIQDGCFAQKICGTPFGSRPRGISKGGLETRARGYKNVSTRSASRPSVITRLGRQSRVRGAGTGSN